MPSSNLALWPAIVTIAKEVKPTRVLDVGIGYGKAGVLLREYVHPKLVIHGVECERRYVDEFPWVYALYDEVRIGKVQNYTNMELADYDLVLMIDVLEHLSMEDGARLLGRIPCRVIVSTPTEFFQNPEADEYESERHRSVWTAEQIAAIRPLEVHDIDAGERLGGVLVRTAPQEGARGA